MNSLEAAIIHETAREVLERHAVAHEKLPTILADLTAEVQASLDQARMSWAHDIRLSA